MSDKQVKSATRAIEMLEYFKLAQQPRSMSELAHDLGYPLSSTTVLLKTLVKMGYVNYDRTRRVYFPTPKVTALGEWIPRALFGAGQILDALNDVHAATHEGVFIGAKNDIYLQYLKTKQSLHALRFHIEEGTVRPIIKSAAGWVLLSTLTDEKIENMVRRANIAVGAPTERVRIKDIFTEIEKIRRNGYAWAENVPFQGGATLAILLDVQVDNQPVTLALGGAEQRMRQNADKYLTVLRDAASTIRATPDFDTPIQIEI
ncbi:helix-turn-helix domain-containing protein [Hoeflea sp. WL0058]|uniref:Helix-turn-helix domain-containing protein n=1 Tax=Flavimaribacter sediminis TaxID=2865987 RepID=A0AAE2ZTN5_9HYPH|nr:helix-turn-helix domain-containing protein [Flavimaribacter sediminis]MBW8640696.1 helix-turn-helix domain-containing protein [Flavimaribacter sediminis]